MKNLLKIAVFFLVLSGIAWGQFDTKEKRGKFYLEFCEKYFPDGTEILEHEKKDWEFTVFTDGETEFDLINDFSTIIHEAYHGYENYVTGEYFWDGTGYYLGDGIRIPVKHTEVYPTPILDEFIADSLKEEMNSRYEPYIIWEKMTIGSHTYGIYGLMEEMNAYYIGGRGIDAAWDYLLENCPDTLYDCMGSTFFHSLSNDVVAYHQFKFFLAWYLEHAETHYPKVYKGILENQPFRVAFTLLDIKFQALETKFRKRIEEFCAMAQARGENVKVNRNYLYRYSGEFGGSGFGIFYEDIERLDNAFLPKWQNYLDRLKVKGVTPENWEKYI